MSIRSLIRRSFAQPLINGPLMHGSCMLAVLLGLSAAPKVRGNETEGASASTQEDIGAQVGIAGHFRPGCWTQLRITGLAAGQGAVVETVDGDGIRLQHRVKGADGAGQTTYLPLGGAGAPVEVTAVDDQGEAIAGQSWQTRLLEGAVAIDRPWIVALGDTLGMESIGENALLSIEGSMAVSAVREPGQLPDAWIGYDGVDLVVISGSSLDLLRRLDEVPRAALREWIQHGGRVLVALGRRGPELLATVPWLADAIGSGEPAEVVRIEPSAVETFTGSREPIADFLGTHIAMELDRTLLSGRDIERQMVPLAWRRSWGFGQLTVFAGGLDEAPFAGWSQREELLDRLLPELIPDRRARAEPRWRGDVRYRELAGQVRSTLDRFAGAGRVQFSAIAAIILVLIGLIGPVDYLVVNRWLGRPLLGWLTFPLTILGFSGAIMLWSGETPPAEVRQIDVVDLDSSLGIGRGFSWAHAFSATAGRSDLRIIAAPQWRSDPNDGGTLTRPWGYAGAAFGGIEVAGEDVRLPPYRLVFQHAAGAQPGAGQLSSRLEGAPFAPLSSKGIAAQWHFPWTAPLDSDLHRRVGSDLLSGSFANPLDVDIVDGYLVYRNLVYLLPTRIPAGERVPAVEALAAKNFRWRLNRRQTTESASESEPWDPAEDRQLDRLMEILLFHQAAGGEKYTGLRNRTLGSLDLSHLLGTDQALLVGRIRRGTSEMLVDGEAPNETSVEQESYVRITLPIDEGEPLRGTR